MVQQLCITPGCPREAVTRSRCRQHATQERKSNRSPFDAFYSSRAWKLSRRKQLFDHPLCQYVLDDGTPCNAVADSVHHIVELRDDGPPRDPTNLMSCCRPHHSVIHTERNGGKVAK